jgi:hypothetical protein
MDDILLWLQYGEKLKQKAESRKAHMGRISPGSIKVLWRGRREMKSSSITLSE